MRSVRDIAFNALEADQTITLEQYKELASRNVEPHVLAGMEMVSRHQGRRIPIRSSKEDYNSGAEESGAANARRTARWLLGGNNVDA